MIQTDSLKFTDPKRSDLPICETRISGEVERERERDKAHVWVCVCVCARLCVFARNIQIAFISDGWRHAGGGRKGWRVLEEE